MTGLAAAGLMLAAPAAAQDGPPGRDGFWSVSAARAGSETCVASLPAPLGGFSLVATDGEVTLAVWTARPMRRGERGAMSTGTHRFEFTPGISDAGDLLVENDVLDAAALAALKAARGVGISVDEQEVLNVKLEGTGLAAALQAAIDCSKGKSGWWGPGVSGD
jgi:hypothetical protein